MKKIALLSDTHGSIHPRVFDFFSTCDEIWHAGDIGSLEVVKKLAAFKPLRAVYGNIDDHHIRSSVPEKLIFTIENVKVFIIHIGGYPGRYTPGVKQEIIKHRPDLFICGHSHILKVIPDKQNKLLHINPGAAGNHGFHQKITLMRFQIDGATIKELEIMEIDRITTLNGDYRPSELI